LILAGLLEQLLQERLHQCGRTLDYLRSGVSAQSLLRMAVAATPACPIALLI
jgi:hypothetical protein